MKIEKKIGSKKIFGIPHKSKPSYDGLEEVDKNISNITGDIK